MSSPKRHHYVSQMHLRRFAADPASPAPIVHTLDVSTGRPSRAAVRDEAVIGQYNRLLPTSEVSPLYVEETLGKLEGAVSRIFDRIVERQPLSDEQRVHLAFFVYLQFQRTPRGRTRWIMQQGMTMALAGRLLDSDRKESSSTPEGSAREAAEHLLAGTVKVTASWNTEVLSMFLGCEQIPVMLLQGMTWVALRAPQDEEFILCDHPVHIYDPYAPKERSGGWFSSSMVQITMPIDPRACLLLHPGISTWREVDASPEAVRDLNLKTYASAETRIYGPSQGLLQSIRTDSRRHRDLVAMFTPRPPGIMVLDSQEDSEGPSSVSWLAGDQHPTIRRFRSAPPSN